MSEVSAQKSSSRKVTKLRTRLEISLIQGRRRRPPKTDSHPTKTGRGSVYTRKEKQDNRTLPFEVKYEASGSKDARTSERIKRRTPSDHIDNYEGDRPPRTPRILQPTDRPAPLQ